MTISLIADNFALFLEMQWQDREFYNVKRAGKYVFSILCIHAMCLFIIFHEPIEDYLNRDISLLYRNIVEFVLQLILFISRAHLIGSNSSKIVTNSELSWLLFFGYFNWIGISNVFRHGHLSRVNSELLIFIRSCHKSICFKITWPENFSSPRTISKNSVHVAETLLMEVLSK